MLIDDVPKIRAALAVARTLQSANAGVGDAGASFPLEAHVRVRARHDGEPAVIDRELDPRTGAEVFVARFKVPVRAVSPGQIAVAYRGDRVLGGGMITRAVAQPGAPS